MPPVIVGVSFKGYFDRDRARSWCAEVAAGVRLRSAVAGGGVRVFVVPTYLQIDDAVRAFDGTGVEVGAQDVSRFPAGAYTGEVSAAELVERHVSHAEIGHAERRRLLGETDADIAAKVAASVSEGLVPVLCVGESEAADPAMAARSVLEQVEADLIDVPDGPVIVAYEPIWAIGAPRPAPIEHIRTVTAALRGVLTAPARAGSAVIYGGSAGPGLLTALGDGVDGVFLGRFAHDPVAFLGVLDEAAALAERAVS